MEKFSLIPNKSCGIFSIGANIRKYLNLPYIREYYEDNNNKSEDYYFYQDHIIAWTTESGKIIAIGCEVACYWKRQNLIGMLDNILIETTGKDPVCEDFYYISKHTNKRIIQRIYRFDSLGLMIWIWHKKVRRVLMYDTRKTELLTQIKRNINWLIEVHENTVSNRKKRQNVINNKEEFGLIPNKSYEVFCLGSKIENYFHLPYLKEDNITKEFGNNTCYTFYNEQVIAIWTNKNNEIETIRCNSTCYWKGQNLINMWYKDFLILSGQCPDSESIEYIPISPDRGQNQKVYTFYDLGLQVWTWRNKIRTVLISKYEQEE